ncbi:AraC family transcriptional regulator [Paenibacillus chondroitinus]|uniref:AraC family transcriptional regulator n=1 Tax=Paenibacillus chondroitinus TaxID=59842 RepID=A0ABU6DDK9_9BACL|nr:MULTISPECIES: AraC family transcriptional regulator [Paenibacillus]MCY9663031.1 AraC family transcriptional regulator [Paenibacillus anseongense]MEB4795850.1 AraC family transcriptional regulator [Paenibacillus chondroitinus]
MLSDFLKQHPIVPFVRQSDFAVRKPWSYPERRLLDYLLVYIQEGTCCFHVDHKKYTFNAGQFCLVQPGSLLSLEGLTNTVTPYIHFDLSFNPEREHSFPTRPGQIDLSAYQHLLQPTIKDLYGVEMPVQVEPSKPLKLKETLLQVIEQAEKQDPLIQLKTQHLVTEIILSLLETYYQAPYTASQSFDWITSYFSHHLSDPISLADMAARANLSISRFSMVFKQRYGISPHQYLMNMRVNHAKELLTHTDLSQESIASYCGFADLHHFSKTFKKRTGLTPGELKKSKIPFIRA